MRCGPGGDKHQRHLLQAGELQLGGERIRPGGDGEIGLVCQDLVHRQRRVAGLEFYFELGIATTKALQHLGQQEVAGGDRAEHPQPPLQRLVAAPELLFELAPLLQQGAAEFAQFLARRGESHAAVVPLEQHAAGFLLQPLDGAAQGGGADRHGVGALAEVEGVGEVEKQFEIAKVHL
ncbi:hypothetical protein D3C81_348060 [compost metagenome]